MRWARIVLVAWTIALAGRAPEVGSEAWCKEMKAKPKGEWTGNDAAEFAKSCVL